MVLIVFNALLKHTYQKSYVNNILDKFLDKYVFIDTDDVSEDGVWCYGVNII